MYVYIFLGWLAGQRLAQRAVSLRSAQAKRVLGPTGTHVFFLPAVSGRA